MSEKLTEEEHNSIVYFHESYGDITRWVGWEETKGKIEKLYPELIDAMNRVVVSERTLDAVIKNLDYDWEE